MAEENKQELLVVEEEQPRQWTFLNYLRGIKRYKWWVIGFSVFGAVAGYLGFKLILNPSKKTLTAAYTYELAGTYSDTDTIRLVDGSTFNPYDLTSRENLQKVKDDGIALGRNYHKVNVDKIVQNNSIAIIKNVTYYNDNDPTSATITYRIEANASLFQTDNIGKQFIYDLVSYSKEISSQAISNYETKSNFTLNFFDLTFDRQIKQLEEQYKTILGVYDALTYNFTDAAIANDENQKIYELRNQFTASYITSGVQNFASELQNTMDANQYINYVKGQEDEKIAEIQDLCETYIETLDNDQKKLKVFEEQLKTLVDSSSIIGSDTNVSKQIAQLSSDITDLKLEINNLEKELVKNGYEKVGDDYVFDPTNVNSTIYKLNEAKSSDTAWSKGVVSFRTKINTYKNDLETDRADASTAYKYCYRQYRNRVNFQDGGYVKLTGGLSSIIGAGVGLLAGFVITTLITAAVYIYRKEEK